MASFSFDPWQILGVAEVVRSWLPWQWRPFVSQSLIWSGFFLIAAIICLGLHFALRTKPKIDWTFERTGYVVQIGTTFVNGQFTKRVEGISAQGENVSGHALHQVDGKITLHRDQRELPLFAIINAAWAALADIEAVPPKAILSLGGQFRGDGVHWQEYPGTMTMDQFLRDFGGFTLSIVIDGERRTWSFSQDELREQIQRQADAIEVDWLSNPMNRPQVLPRQR